MIKTFSQAGNNRNEDSFFACQDFCFVIDGATGLSGEKVSPMQSDAQWFAICLRDYLKENLKTNKPIKEIMKNAVVYVNEEFEKFEGAEKVNSRPSAGISLFRVCGNKVEYFVLGDCSVVFKFKNNEINHIHGQDLEKLDKININLMAKIAKEKNINVIDARPLISNELLNTRNLQNKPNGYYIFSNSIEAINHGLHGFFDKSEISQIMLTSDGYSQIFDLFEHYTLSELFDLVKEKQLEEIYKTLYNLQEKDKNCNNYPRFKTRDDATAVSFEF